MAASAPRQQSQALHERVRKLIARAMEPAEQGAQPAMPTDGRALGSEPLQAELDALGLDLARFQARHVPAVAQLFAARGLDAATLVNSEQIPALHCDVFRLRRVAAHPAADDERCFRTSGTTQGAQARGEHALRTTATYAAAALAWAERMLWPDGAHLGLIGLVASETVSPQSSLSFMLARFAERLGGGASWHFDGRELDLAGAHAACAAARDKGEAQLVAGTAFAFVELRDRFGPGVLELPAASRVMLTGGFKGRSREVRAEALRTAMAGCFGLAESHIVGEYGMTELSSQLYEGTLAGALGRGLAAAKAGCYLAPPWVRVSALDPVTLVRTPLGQAGVARILDLANVDSAVAVLTADLVREQADGSIELLGRAPGAAARGCSLSIEEALQSDAEGDVTAKG